MQGSELLVVNGADGSRVRTIQGVTGPVWSPTAAVIAFTRNQISDCRSPNNPLQVSLRVVDARTGVERTLLQGLQRICRASGPVAIWSPTGRHIMLCDSCGGL